MNIMTDAFVKEDAALNVVNEYGQYCRPQLVQLLTAIGLDVAYEKALGNNLWYRKDNKLIKVLDFAGGFGSTLFGHNHTVLVKELQKLLKNQVPVMAQGSCRINAAKLAHKLTEMVDGDYVTIFTNSGTEVVEAALKHAHLETGNSIIWAVRGGFHGKTLGSIQMTSSYCSPFSLWGPEVRFLDPDDPADWTLAVEETGENVAAIFVEAIQGEGGVKALPENFVSWVKSISKQLKVPLVADEIQTGMGRTGEFLASTSIGLDADYICLSKSLGGGLVKIGALMIKRKRLVDEFVVIQTSTFAEDDLSCGIALKALELLSKDKIPERCESMGGLLLSQLNKLKEMHPDVIADVRGRGLMIGIELHNQDFSPSNIIKMLSQQGYLGWMASGYLLNVYGIRITPTLNQYATLRVQPSAYISSSDIDELIHALDKFCTAVKYSDAGHLTAYQIGLHSESIIDWRDRQPSKLEQPATEKQVAFMGHFLSPQHVADCDPSVSTFPSDMLGTYLSNTSAIVGASITDQINVKSITGDQVHIRFLGLNLTASQISDQRGKRNLAWIRGKVESAAQLAHDVGCQVVGFGGYTSSVTGNCRRVGVENIALTSGNSLTIGMALEALKQTAIEEGIGLHEVPVAVVGVPGNISSIAAMFLAAYASELILVQRSMGDNKLQELVTSIKAKYPKLTIKTTNDLSELRDAKLILSATVSGGGIINSSHLGDGKKVICDVSVPPDVVDDVLQDCPNTTVINGGVVKLPLNDDFSIAGIPLEKGRVFACMAETLLMGLEGYTEHGTYGDITIDGVNAMLSHAKKHGFELDIVRRQLK